MYVLRETKYIPLHAREIRLKKLKKKKKLRKFNDKIQFRNLTCSTAL